MTPAAPRIGVLHELDGDQGVIFRHRLSTDVPR
jgi:hypothetical protein